jgi:CRISPR/Cas system-associated protein Cas10 (large subunit of type III CRISPR-Cas system)
MLLITATFVAMGMAVYIVFPLLTAETAGGPLPLDVTLLGDLKRRRLVLYDNLKDLEFEYQSGKIAREDYSALRTNYLSEAAALMAATQEAELLKRDDALVEREIAARRAQRKSQRPSEYTCSACGYENPLPVKFCGECGARIEAPGKKRG